MNGRCGHAVYLAVIAVLVILVVYAFARATRAVKLVKEVNKRFGPEGARAAAPRKEPLRPPTDGECLRPRSYGEYRREVDALIGRALDLGEFGGETRLADSCRHALEGGKRLRAIAVLEIARRVAENRRGPGGVVDAAEAALFLEYLHAAALIIDDLPHFDDDRVRRGRPALHARDGEARAQMAAAALVAAAFQNLCRQADWVRDHCPEVANPDRILSRVLGEASRALGALGAAGGQYLDCSSAEELERECGPDAIMDLLHRKTATFFELAFITGWVVGGGAAGRVDDVRRAGKHFGLAFQIADDVGDAESDAARRRSGKPGWNIANVLGLDVAEDEFAKNLAACRHYMVRLGLWTPLWENEIFPVVRSMATPARETAGGEPAPAGGPGEKGAQAET